MIAKYEFKPLTVDKARALALSLGYEGVGEEMSLAEIYKMKEPAFQQEERKKIGFS